ncbi:MAG: C40 family peptidase [Lachnospira sp.]
MKKLLGRISKTVTAVLGISLMLYSPISLYAENYMDTDNVEYVIVDDDTTTMNLRTVDESSIYAASQSRESGTQSIDLATGVTEQMCNASFWTEKAVNPSALLMTKDEIAALNGQMLSAAGTYMYDLENVTAVYDGNAVKQSLANVATPSSTFYIDGVKIADKEAYFQSMRDNIAGAVTSTSDSVKYAVAVKYADMKSWPTSDILGYSADDTDDELQASALCVNEPFVVKAVTADGRFCWGYSSNCTGWIASDCLAICSSKAEWLDSWKVDVNSKDFLVVTTNKILLENSMTETSTANVLLTLGTMLKLVPQSEIPANILERGTWNNYVVYLPTRDANGKYVKKYALISMHYNVSKGYLNLTQENVMNVAFECLGDRYGWGGMLNAFDCSLYTRTIYRCFGLEIPRNTTWQQAIPGHKKDISSMTDEQKLEELKQTPIGSLIFMRGHVVVYTGNYEDCAYAISATGTLADSAEGSVVESQQNIILTPLTVKRGNGTTWLNNMTAIVYFGELPLTDINDCSVEIKADSIAYSGAEQKPEVVVTYSGEILEENESYILSYSNNILAGEAKVTITGIGDYKGTADKTFTINKASYSIKSADYYGEYDGNAHSISLSEVYEGSTIEYKISEDGEWIKQKPARIKEGTTTVYYRITNPNYETITGQNTITITGSDSTDSSVQTGDPYTVLLWGAAMCMGLIIICACYKRHCKIKE